ncbi:MAG: GNAT family N-acetyltransferase [Christensenellales bacterium]|jgi:ribosomal protein S18 acetylase RimI-like enzyme
MAIQYLDTVKALPADQLRRLFMAVGWSDGSETPQQQERFNIGFIHATLVVSAWEGERLIGAVRVLSDQVFRSIIYDLLVDPDYQHRGIGRELARRCMAHYPTSEWLVQTTPERASFYEGLGFQVNGDVFLSIPCKLFTIAP